MSAQDSNMSGEPTQGTHTGSDAPIDKGKGRAVEPSRDIAMGDDDDEDSSDEESAAEEAEAADAGEDDDEEDMQEIDTDNIIGSGRRTRGKNIDFAKAAQEIEEDDDDEDDDGDFEDPDESMES